MIRINLLPHREEKRRRRQAQFARFALLSGLAGAVVAGGVWFTLDQRVQSQQSNIDFLKAEIAKLDKQIEEIRRIREETASLLAKKQVVEGLQSNRSEPVYLLDQVLRQVPEGIQLKSMKQTGTRVNVVGYAQSNARVSTFMRNIGSSENLQSPELVEIKAVSGPGVAGAAGGGARANEFSLNFSVKRGAPAAPSEAPKKP
jgi:type IV pilus assembly protein PilN